MLEEYGYEKKATPGYERPRRGVSSYTEKLYDTLYQTMDLYPEGAITAEEFETPFRMVEELGNIRDDPEMVDMKKKL